MVSNVLPIICGGDYLFYPAINFDLKSFRLQFSEFGKQVRRSTLQKNEYAMAPYRLYFINNRYFFEQAAEDLIGLANFLQDLGGSHRGYYDYQNRWAHNPSNHGSLEGNTLQEVLVNTINNQFSNYSHWESNHPYIFNYYRQWAEQAFIPNNFLGYFRLIIKQYSVRFYREWYLNKGDYGDEELYQEISEILSKVLTWYRNEKPLLRFRENYDPEAFNEVMVEYQHLADVLSLYKEVWFRGTPGYPTGENPVPTPESMNEALFELGMEDSLPDWDYEICPKCDNKGVVNNRRCSKCKGFGYLADQRIYPLKYAGSFSTGEQRSMNRESAWPVRRFGVRDNLSLPTSERLRELASRAKL
tara:strand:+ start:13433 stop:14506 length:1074 start_codon:yes stop_codon:yes gene_type:complete